MNLRSEAKKILKQKNKPGKSEDMFCGYDYSTRERREETVATLFHRAKIARGAVEQEWMRYNDYYHFIHDVTGEIRDYADQSGFKWAPPVMPDAWIAVESQVDPDVPEPEFRGRDSDMDSKKARQREYAVKYICEHNHLESMNTRNERRLLKYGDAFWKAYWDNSMRCGINEGNIRIKDIPVDAIYPDPSVRDGTIQDGQYLDYVYRVHKVKFTQMFRRDLEKLGIKTEEIMGRDYQAIGGIFDLTTAIEDSDDTVQVLEHWFRQPAETEVNGERVPEGAIGCSIQAGGYEIKYIPNYWKRTGRQCQLFPFVHYWRIQDENQIWNRSELYPVMDLIDAADRKLVIGTYNDALLSNDLIVVEEGTLSDGQEITNSPGDIIYVKQNKLNSIRRLGGLQSMSQAAVTVEWYKNQIERTNRNYETSRGKESERTNTASGLAMLRADAGKQDDIKKSDRNEGFVRLYQLLDWLALEFFDDNRMIYLGAKKDSRKESVAFHFNSGSLSELMPALADTEGNVVRDEYEYWPDVDVTITASDSVVKGKQQTLEALQVLTQAQITPDNWELFAAQLEILDVPGRQDIVNKWKAKFEPMGAGGGANTSETPALTGTNPVTSGLPNLPGGIPMNI